MHLFGEPGSPRKDLWDGAGSIALSAFALGMAFEGLFSRPVASTDYINIVLWIAMLLLGVSQFRLGLASIPKEPEKSDHERATVSGGVRE
jgi:hypothetical protein